MEKIQSNIQTYSLLMIVIRSSNSFFLVVNAVVSPPSLWEVHTSIYPLKMTTGMYSQPKVSSGGGLLMCYIL